MTLHLGPGIDLPLDAVTRTFGIVAQKGSGKTYTSSVFVEELAKEALPFVVIDPLGVWWGLRSSADGKRPGLPVLILGGDHGDVPLEPTAGEVVADFIIDNPAGVVLDISLFRKADQRRFVTAFLSHLYHRNRNALHVVLDEADLWAPQRPQKGQEALLGACEDLVRRGRARGVGVTLITQRPAVIHKDVLTQIDVLIALRIVGPQDRAAVELWIKANAFAEDSRVVIDSLASLPIGTAWVWSPGWLELLKKVKIRKRETFDSSATPKHGDRPIIPTALAEVDLDALKVKMAGTIERAMAEDPRVLTRKIIELEQDVRARDARIASLESRPPPVEVQRQFVPTLDPAFMADMRRNFQQVIDRAQNALELIDQAQLAEAERIANPMLGFNPEHEFKEPGTTVTLSDAETFRFEADAATVKVFKDAGVGSGVELVDGVARIGRTALDLGAAIRDHDLKEAHRKLLTVLAKYGPRTTKQLALQAGYSHGGGGFNRPLGQLRTMGYATKGSPVSITDAGRDALGAFEPLPHGPQLLNHWCLQLPNSEAKILAIASAKPSWDRDELAAEAGYTNSNAGGFNRPLGRLRTLGLVAKGSPIRLTDDFADAIR